MASSPIQRIAQALGTTGQYEFRIHWSKDRQFYWELHSTRGNREPVADSETYTSKESALHSINQIKALAATAMVRDLTAK